MDEEIIVSRGHLMASDVATGSTTEYPPRKKKKRKPPVRSEIAHIDYELIEWFEEAKILRETIKERKTAYCFFVQAVGPEGRYRAGVSATFQATVTTSYRRPSYIDHNSNADAALNQLLGQLWSEGWQPTSFGQHWYEIRLRRTVPNS